MKIIEFRGASMGTIEGLLNAKKIIESQTEQTIIVVSALGGVTSQLIEIFRLAENHDRKYEKLIQQLRQRHLDVIDSVVLDQNKDQCRQIITKFIDLNITPYCAMLMVNKELDISIRAKLREVVLAHGEIMASAIVSSMVEDSSPHFAPNFIKTRDSGYERIIDWESTEELVRKEFENNPEQRIIVQGYIAGDITTGHKTTLGRCGDDYTAAILATVLKIDSFDIWTNAERMAQGVNYVHPAALQLADNFKLKITLRDTYDPQGKVVVIR